MAIADHIAVMDHGHIEQVGSPLELYDQPASRFVMGFLGAVSQLGDKLVRPHDIAILTEPDSGTFEAQVSRITYLGFEVRVDLTVEGQEPVAAQLTRDEATQMELAEGDIVWLRPTAGRDVGSIPGAAPEAAAPEAV